MTPRGTDWSLALLVGLAFATGVLTFFAGARGDAWLFVLHSTGGLALGLVLGWKLRRVWRRVVEPVHWDRKTVAGLAALALVAGALGSGIVFATGGNVYIAGYNLLVWHFVLGSVLALLVLTHALVRGKLPRTRDILDRRQFLAAAGVAVGAVAVWRVQRPVAAFFNWRGAQRRWTGSYEEGSFAGNDFPTTSWVADQPRPLPARDYRLTVGGLVESPLELSLSELGAGDQLEATLDCTGGFYSTQHWHGIALGRLIDRAAPLPSARHVRVVSHTGYRWSFSLDDARDFLLATRVGDEALSHEHGAPARLVAPGRRGFQWVKWVVELQLDETPDHGAPASTIWSSFTRAGRGEV